MATLPRRVRIIFSDLDGTLVHFEKHFRGFGSVHALDEVRSVATRLLRALPPKCFSSQSPTPVRVGG